MNTDLHGLGNQERRRLLAMSRHGFLHGINQETKHQGTMAWAAVDK
jgi:hypothetical protein